MDFEEYCANTASLLLRAKAGLAQDTGRVTLAVTQLSVLQHQGPRAQSLKNTEFSSFGNTSSFHPRMKLRSPLCLLILLNRD